MRHQFGSDVRLAAILCTLLALLSACAVTRSNVDSESQALMANHPLVFRLESYEFDPASTVVDRIGPMPDFVLAYLEELDSLSYTRYQPDPAEIDLFSRHFEELPPRIQRAMNSRTVGIYFLEENFIGGGLVEALLSPDGELYTIMILNKRVLDLSLSDWITYRENTVFARSDCEACDGAITAVVGDEYQGLMHILLHEGTHVVDYAEGVTPYLQGAFSWLGWEGEIADDAFVMDVWQDFATPASEYEFPGRRSITYYGLHGGPYLELD